MKNIAAGNLVRFDGVPEDACPIEGRDRDTELEAMCTHDCPFDSPCYLHSGDGPIGLLLDKQWIANNCMEGPYRLVLINGKTWWVHESEIARTAVLLSEVK